MTIDVRGPKVPQPNAQPTIKGPVTQAPTGISGTQALKNAEGMFNKTFEKMGEGSALILENLATIGTPLVKDNLQTPQVKQEIVQVFQELKAMHLKEKPSGQTADAFEHPTLTALVSTFTAEDVESGLTRMMDMPLSELPPQAQRALRAVSDAKFSSKLDNMVTSEQLQSTPEYQFFASPKGQTLLKQATPQIMSLVAYLNGKTDTGKTDKTDHKRGSHSPKNDPFGFNTKGANKGEPKGSGSKETEAASSASDAAPVDDSGVVELFDKLSPVVSSAMRMFGDDMDISSMIIILMGLLAKDAEDDLKEMMKKMQHNLQIKNAKRDMKHAMEDDLKKLNETAQQQLDQLKKDGLVPESLSLSDYLSYCQVDGAEPILNEETGDWQTFPPTLTPPSPLPREWEPEDKGGSGLTFSKMPNITAVNLGQTSLLNGITNAPADMHVSSVNKNISKVSDTTSNIINNMRQGSVGGSAAYGDNVPKGNGNTMQTKIDRLQDDIDSMGSQSELDQTRMQLYMDRRAKAFETLSNLQKKISESLAAIIKNQT